MLPQVEESHERHPQVLGGYWYIWRQKFWWTGGLTSVVLIYYTHVWYQLQVRSLEKHAQWIPEKADRAYAKSNTPQSEVDPNDFHAWVDQEKVSLALVETDIRDAKRRVTLTKGPKRRTAAAAEGSDGEDGDASCSDDLLN